jgi:predicted porin
VNCADPTCSIVRYDNTIEYKSPVVGGFQAFVQKSNKQSKAINTNYIQTLGALNMPGMTEVAVKYSNGPLTVAYVDLATDATGVATAATAAVKRGLKTLSGAYDLGNGFRVAAMNQKVNAATTLATTTSDRTANQVAATYTWGPNTIGLDQGQSKENNAAKTLGGGQTSKFTGVAYRYELSKMTSLQAKWESLDDKAYIVTMPTQFGATRIDNKRTRSTLGMLMAF